MNIIIAGGGKVGKTLLRQLTAEGHNLTLIDRNAKTLSDTVEDYDLIAVSGNCATRETLISAGIMDADLLIAVTGADETNLLCAMTAHGLRPNLHTIARIRNPEYSEQVLAIAQSLGYTTVQWSYAYVDWEVDNQPDVDKSYKRLMKAAHSGCIYLLHAVSTTNASLLGDLIDGLRGEGYGFGLFGENA